MIGVLGVAFDNTIAQSDDAVGILSDIFFMGNQNYRVAVFVYFVEEIHNFNRGFTVEISGWLIGQDDRWSD